MKVGVPTPNEQHGGWPGGLQKRQQAVPVAAAPQEAARAGEAGGEGDPARQSQDPPCCVLLAPFRPQAGFWELSLVVDMREDPAPHGVSCNIVQDQDFHFNGKFSINMYIDPKDNF